MSAPVSPHHPIHAGAIETVTGTLVVRTGLRDLQSYAVSFVGAPVAGAAYVHAVESIDGGEAVLTINVLTNAFAVSVTAKQISWIALGK